jgi:hypothetical protein
MSVSIDKKIIARTIGENDGISQVFTKNYIPEIVENPLEPKIFKVPLFSIQGATKDYYEQNISSVSVNINNNKVINYNYSANTSSFSAITRVLYDVYRIDNDVYDKVYNNYDEEGEIIDENQIENIDTIREYLENPLIQLIDSGNTITTPNYTLELPEIIKPTGKFAEPLLVDKNQYFIDTRFEFLQKRDRSLGAFQTLSAGTSVEISYDNLSNSANTLSNFSTGDFIIETSKDREIIEKGIFTDLYVNGYFFTYFVAPQKPNIDIINDEPSVKGLLDTFSPIFSFNNVSDGDYYKLQVTYDLADTTFTGSTIFKIPKQEGDAEFIRSFSTPLSPDANFLYRIGNTKEIVNVFGVKQNVTTWSRAEQAFTATDGIFDISGTIFQDELYGSPISGASIEFIVISTTADVELGVDAPYDEEILGGLNEALGGGAGTTFSGITDANGNYTVNNIKGGTLGVKITHPYYSDTITTYNVTQSENGVDFIMELPWGSTGTTFGNVGGQLFI